MRMVKLMFFCRRRADITHDQYVDMLLRDHVPLALRHHPSMLRYTVNIVELSPSEAEADSIGELYFDKLSDFHERLYDSPAGEKIIAADVQRFMGHADAYVTMEHIQKDEQRPPVMGQESPSVKMVFPMRRRADITHDQFVDHWLGTHAPLACKHHPGLSKYVTNVVDARLSPNSPEWDGIAELHFPSLEALATGMFDSPAGEAIIRADIERFIGPMSTYRVREFVQRR